MTGGKLRHLLTKCRREELVIPEPEPAPWIDPDDHTCFDAYDAQGAVSATPAIPTCEFALLPGQAPPADEVLCATLSMEQLQDVSALAPSVDCWPCCFWSFTCHRPLSFGLFAAFHAAPLCLLKEAICLSPLRARLRKDLTAFRCLPSRRRARR